jgi:hypothetical protein
MFFNNLQNSLLHNLKTRVSNGELTERGLARLVGISQPHMHNVLNGRRILSSELADQILEKLHISVLDLIERRQLTDYLTSAQPMTLECTYVPLLKGVLGPGHPWPSEVDRSERVAIPTSQPGLRTGIVVVRLAHDIRMGGVFSAGDLALLDQSFSARCTLASEGLYVLKRGNLGVIRRLRTVGSQTYIVTEDNLKHPAAWERISVEIQYIQHVVRARAILVAKDREW